MWPKRTEKLWDDNNSSQQEFDCQLIEMKYEFREIEDERKKNKFQRIKCAENTSDITHWLWSFHLIIIRNPNNTENLFKQQKLDLKLSAHVAKHTKDTQKM